MALTKEWVDRIEAWRRELANHLYEPLRVLPLSGFVTREQLPLAEAVRRKFRPMPVGTPWGRQWEYGWFRCTARIPRIAAGRRIVFRMDSDSESLVFVNGRAEGSLCNLRPELALTPKARGDETFDIVLETYAGHGPTPFSVGPVPVGRVTVPEPAGPQRTVREASFGIWDEDAFQLLMDVETLWGMREALDDRSLRVSEIDAGLSDFTTLVDFELEPEAKRRSFHAARRRLRPLLACRNGSTNPTLFGFGHGHLDVAWLWPLAETERKIARTVSGQLALMGEYPKFKFLQSQPHLYGMLKAAYPELYRRVRQAVRDGQLIAEGSMWVEPDMNIAGGEALVRQCLHGKRFFREEFGVDNELLWLPDVFGYSAALPQILRGCGVKYFATAKIFWNYHGGDPFPYHSFHWEGIDGTAVLAHLFYGYQGPGDARSAIERWQGRVQRNGISSTVFCFGHGDGGGGPTRTHVEAAHRLADLEGVPHVRLAGPVEFFRDLESRGVATRYVGELYFQAHRGTYTSQARTKRANRKSEMALREAEIWGAAAARLARFKYPLAAMDRAWKDLLVHQFHDILPGSSIARVYAEAEKALAGVIDRATETARQAMAALVSKRNGITVFNSLNWRRTALVELPAGWRGAKTPRGAIVPAQKIGTKRFAEVDLPSCGWTSLEPAAGSAAVRGGAVAGRQTLENERLKLRFHERGEIVSLFDKDAGRELAAGPCNRFQMWKDVPSSWDAWDIDSMYTRTPVALRSPATFRIVASGPLVAALEIRRRLHDSDLIQVVSLRRGSRCVEFKTTVQWRESHKLLKVAFPVTVRASEAVHEIQFGHLRRPTHASRPYDADRFEVAHQKWTALVEEGRGCAVLNDCKYGVNVVGSSINLTLLRAPKAPDMNADLGRQEFTYAFYSWNGSLADSGLVREAYELNSPGRSVPGLGGEQSLFCVDAPNIVIEVVKPAEDGSGDLVVRLYESMRTATRCTLTTSLPVKKAMLTNMLEDPGPTVRVAGKRMALDFHPFEIKTLRIRG